MRFPPSPQFLMNAAAMGAERGRGRVRGALPGAPAGHGRRPGEPDQQHRRQQHPGSPGRHQHVEPPAELQPRRHQRGQVAVAEPRAAGGPDRRRSTRPWTRSRPCVEEFETTTLEDWRANNTIEIVEDVDRAAFQTKAEAYLRENFTQEQVPVLEAIRSTRAVAARSRARGRPVAGASPHPDIPPPLAWRIVHADLKGDPADDGPGGSAGLGRDARHRPLSAADLSCRRGPRRSVRDTQAELLPTREPLRTDPSMHRPRRAGHRRRPASSSILILVLLQVAAALSARRRLAVDRRGRPPGPRLVHVHPVGLPAGPRPAHHDPARRLRPAASGLGVLKLFVHVVVGATCLAMAYAIYQLIADDIGQRTPAAEIPLAWIYVVPLVGFAPHRASGGPRDRRARHPGDRAAAGSASREPRPPARPDHRPVPAARADGLRDLRARACCT